MTTAAAFSWLAELSARDPQQPLLLDGDRAWTAGEVCDQLFDLSYRLAPGRVLGVLADNSPAWVVADLAAQEAERVHLPLPAFFTAGQLKHALEQTATDLVLSDQPERIEALGLGFSRIDFWQGLALLRREVAPRVLPTGTAKISYTSGSTGTPKGVCLSAKGLLATARAVRDRLADLPLRRHLAVMPLALLLENVAGVHAPLLRGLPVHLPSLGRIGWRGMASIDPLALDGAVRAAGASSVILVPELLKAWTAGLALSGRRATEELLFVAVGGARVSDDLIGEARRLGLPAYQGYGLTEGGSVLTLNRPGDDGIGVGRPLAHARLFVRGGEVVVESAAFLGYLGEPAAAADCFATGDLAQMDDAGHLHLAGRRKNLLITSFGRNVSPEWPEAALLADPRIVQAVVIGDGEPTLTAIVVPLPGVSASVVEQAIDCANETLPDYARIGHWRISEPFSVGNGLATGNGRPIRQRIVERFAAQLAGHRNDTPLSDPTTGDADDDGNDIDLDAIERGPGRPHQSTIPEAPPCN